MTIGLLYYQNLSSHLSSESLFLYQRNRKLLLRIKSGVVNELSQVKFEISFFFINKHTDFKLILNFKLTSELVSCQAEAQSAQSQSLSQSLSLSLSLTVPPPYKPPTCIVLWRASI
jgi:hypothetical protein